MKTNILIVEDEILIAMGLEQRLKNMGYQVAGIAQDYHKARALLASEKVDLALLDINLSGKESGVEVAQYINEHHKIPIIFLTAFKDKGTFEKTKSTVPFAYLTKPVKDDALQRSIELALMNKNQMPSASDIMQLLSQVKPNPAPDTLFVKEGSSIRRINISKILFVEAMDNYAIIQMEGERVIIHEKMKELEEKLATYKIIRIHRSYLIAVNKIDKVEDDFVLIGSKEIPLSRSHRKSLIESMKWL